MPLVEQTPPSSRGRILRRFAIRFLISLAIGGGLFYLAFRGLRPRDLLDAFRKAHYLWIGPFFLTLVGVQLFRAWRWRYLLVPITAHPPGLWRLLMISSVGFAAIMLLPLRLGEFVRPFLIADPRRGGAGGGGLGARDPRGEHDDGDVSGRQGGCRERGVDAAEQQGDSAGTAGGGALPAPPVRPVAQGSGLDGERLRMSAALGTIAVERVVDGLLVSLFLFGSFLLIGDQPGAPTWMMPTAYTALAVFGGAMVFLASGLRWPRQAVAAALTLSGLTLLANRFGGRAARLRDRLEDLLQGLISGFAALSNAGCLSRFVAFSLLYWFFNGLGFWVLARAFHLELALVPAFALCGMVAIGIILPAGPGLVGNFHEFGKFGLQLSLPAAAIAGPGMAFVVLLHGLHFVWYVGWGLAALRSRHVRAARVLQATVSEDLPIQQMEREMEKETEAGAGTRPEPAGRKETDGASATE